MCKNKMGPRNIHVSLDFRVKFQQLKIKKKHPICSCYNRYHPDFIYHAIRYLSLYKCTGTINLIKSKLCLKC